MDALFWLQNVFKKFLHDLSNVAVISVKDFICLSMKAKKMMSYVLHPPKKSLAEPDKAHKQNSAVAHN